MKINFKSPKFFAICLVPIVALGLGYIAIGEIATWQFGKQSSQISQSIAKLIDTNVSDSKSISQNLTTVKDSLKKCNIAGMYYFAANVYPRAKTAKNSCFAAKSRASAVSANIQGILTTKQYLTDLTSSLKEALAIKDTNADNMEKYYQTWAKAYSEVQKVTPQPTLSAQHSALVAAVKEVCESWQKLSDGNTNKNLANYNAGKNGFADAYKHLQESATQLESAVNSAQNSLNLAIK